MTDSIHFNVTNFNAQDPEISYQGDARASNAAAQIANSPEIFRIGWVTHTRKIPIWDSASGRLTDFTTNFSFTIDTRGRNKTSDGLAFFLAPVGFTIPLNSVGGYLGLYNSNTLYSPTPSYQTLMVEFDTHSNTQWDPPYPHVGINENSLSSAVSTSWNYAIHSGDVADASVSYNATAKNLTVSWSYRTTTIPGEESRLSLAVDLSKVLPEWVIAGFSASTADMEEHHNVMSWEFNSSLVVDDEAGSKLKSKSRLMIIIPTIGAAIALTALGIIFTIWRKRTRLVVVDQQHLMVGMSINKDLERGTRPTRFSYQELAAMTNSFSQDRKLGEGGSGAVYKGYLSELDLSVAVKRISKGSKQARKEFLSEVKTIGQLRHRNLVPLVGWCYDEDEFLLVYEYMPYGSLDSHLFGGGSFIFNWSFRYKISLGLASGLHYLHEEWEQCVVHRDVKPSNILVDSGFNAKLGDFGLAKLVEHGLGGDGGGGGGESTTILAGTLGYLAPECITTGRVSKESDVYSFGVVLLEITTGRKVLDPINEEKLEMSLVSWIWHLYECGELISAVDPRLGSEFDYQEAERLLIVGLWCAQSDSKLRPTIHPAIQALKCETLLPILSDIKSSSRRSS
ncbi:L-type lectin-domain containing receptor kinase IX.1 [Linum perenne]